MTEKELDKIFQKGSEKYDFEYNEKAWEEMENLLDKSSKRKKRIFLWWIFGGLLVVAITLGIRFINNENLINKTVSETHVLNTDIKKNIKDDTNNSEINNYFNREKTIDSITKDQNYLNNKSNSKDSVVKKGESSVLKNIETKQNLNQKESPSRNYQKDFLVLSKSDSTQNTTYDSTILEKNENRNNTNLINKKKLIPFDELVSLPILVCSVTSMRYQETTTLSNDMKLELNRNSMKFKNRLLVGFSFSSESSIVNHSEYSKLNWKLGTQLSYRFYNHYYIELSANYIEKTYSANKGSYIPPIGFWTRKIIPKISNGQNKILELPFKIGYFFKDYDEKGFYSNIGISSYIMLKENYNYKYTETDQDLIRNWHTKSPQQYWLGMGTFSIGYQYFLKSNSIIQIAPYVHVPIKGVGHGQVKLWSLGMNFKMKFAVH